MLFINEPENIIHLCESILNEICSIFREKRKLNKIIKWHLYAIKKIRYFY